MRLGRHGRDLPPQSSRKVPLYDHCLQLAPQLGYRIRHTLHGQPWCGQRQPRRKGLLRLGFLLFYLRLLCLGYVSRACGCLMS